MALLDYTPLGMAMGSKGMGGIADTLSGGNNSKAAQAQQQAVDMFKDINAPDLQNLDLNQLVQQGVLTPEQAQTYLADPSAFNKISLDPKLQQAQMDALASLQNIGNSGGMTAEDKANLSRISTGEDVKQRGAREAILQNAQARGLGGSGMEILAQLQNQQDSATRQNQRDLDVAGQAQARALQSLQQAGQLGGQIGQQQFAQQAQVAGANDAISKFNASQKQDVGNLNTNAANAAQAANLASKQKIADANVGIQNQQQITNKSLPQQEYENELKKAGGVGGALGQQGQGYLQAGEGIQKLIGAGAGAAGTAVASDERLKEDVKPWDASEFLDSLTPSKYHYKDDRFGKGSNAGVMAQDLEKTPEGKSMVENTPDGKMVDYGKGFGALTAAMADLHERLKKVEGA